MTALGKIMGNTRRWLVALACTILVAAVTCCTLPAQETQPSVNEARVQHLYAFVRFVRWPAASGESPIGICTAGASNGLSDELSRTVADQAVGGRSLRLRAVIGTELAGDCDVLFLDAHFASAGDLLQAAADKPILTVSDAPGFAEHGGMIELVAEDHQEHFLVNLTPVSKSGLTLSSELLKVAQKVIGGPGDAGGVQ